MRLESATLEDRFVRLEPFAQALGEELRAAIGASPDGWELITRPGFGEHFDGWWAESLRRQGKARASATRCVGWPTAWSWARRATCT